MSKIIKPPFTHASLFSGIGGPDLAAEWMGWDNIFHCEKNTFGQRVLKYYWPNAELFDDITKSDFTKYANKITVLSGGFPCQPYSIAGLRKGKEDDRHLWPEMLRAIREIKPVWVVGENVLGLVNWSGGLVFDEVQSELEAEGYKVQSFILPAAAVNAPHRRDRCWIIAYSDSNRRDWSNGKNEIDTSKTGVDALGNPESSFSNGSTSDADSKRREKRESPEKPAKKRQYRGNDITRGNADDSDGVGLSGEMHRNQKPAIYSRDFPRVNWDNFPNEPPVYHGNDGLPPRLDGITFPKWRNESIKAGGNAIVPHVVYNIFQSIAEYHLLYPE